MEGKDLRGGIAWIFFAVSLGRSTYVGANKLLIDRCAECWAGGFVRRS